MMYDNSKYYAQPAIEQRSMALYMSKVYGWMSMALFVTAISAYLVGTSEYLAGVFLGNPFVFWGLIISEFLLVIGINYMIDKMGAALASALFILFATINGITLSAIFIVYTLPSIGTAFATTAGTFGVMSFYGYVTKRDLTTIGNICFMALIGLIIAGLVNMFLQNDMMSFITACFGVLIFVGLTAYDTQKIKEMLLQAETSTETVGKIAILGALSLYLDFINLFLYILRLIGGRK